MAVPAIAAPIAPCVFGSCNTSPAPVASVPNALFRASTLPAGSTPPATADNPVASNGFNPDSPY